MTEDTVRRNQAGAIIHDDINQFVHLDIPMIIKEEDAPIYEVISAGFVRQDKLASVMIDRITMSKIKRPIVTIKKDDGSIEAYQLPLELEEWVDNCMHASSEGYNPFPCKVAFGIIGNEYYIGLK